MVRQSTSPPGARPVGYAASYGPDGEPFRAPTDDRARFLVERYRYFTMAQDGTVRYASIDHAPWTLTPARADVDRNTLLEANGFETPAGGPVRYYSEDLTVSASASKRWAG